MKQPLLLIFFLSVLLVGKSHAQLSGEGESFSYKVNISPNPFEEKLKIEIEHGSTIITGVKIYDLIGKEKATIDFQLSSSVYILNLSHLEPGIYFCRIISSKGIVETRKLIRSTPN